MEEIHLQSLDLSADAKSGASDNASLQKVYRKGDKIFQLSSENVTMLKEALNEDTITKSLNDDEAAPVDQVASGESLFKTFSFDNTISKEETEKCIAFWRSVVEKNLEPIKCTIIDNVNQAKLLESAAEKKEPPVEKKTRRKPKKKPVVKEATLDDRKKHVWVEILQELQKKRLNETKLLMDKRCRFCDYLSAQYETDDYREQFKQEIKELDTWTPKQSTSLGGKVGFRQATKRSISSTDGSHRISNASQRSSSNSAAQAAPSVDKDALLDDVKKASRQIEYVDAVELKRQQRVYSKWRSNTLEPVCACGRTECDCNKNPAVTGVTLAEENKSCSLELQSAHDEQVDGKCEPDIKKEPELDDYKEICEDIRSNLEEIVEKIDTKSAVEDKVKTDAQNEENADKSLNIFISNFKTDSLRFATDDDEWLDKEPSFSDFNARLRPKRSIIMDSKSTSRHRVKKSLSVMLDCICSTPDCDCKKVIEVMKKPPAPPKEVTRPPTLSIVARRDSLELIKRRLSRTDTLT